MRFDRESWRKLYRDESVEHRLLPVLARGLRDYLLRHAKDDGTILARTEDPGADLARALGAHADEFETVSRYVGDWIRDGYLSHVRGKLAIKNFKAAQQSRTPEAERQRRFRDKKRNVECVTSNVTPGVTSNVTPVTPVTPTRAPARLVSSRLVSSEPEGEAGETVCPPTLATDLEALGVVAELASALKVRAADVRHALDEFVGYWTIGAGCGDRRRHWPKRARERIRELHAAGRLAGCAGRDAPDPEQQARDEAALAALVASELHAEPLPVDEAQKRVAAVLARARGQSTRTGGSA